MKTATTTFLWILCCLVLFVLFINLKSLQSTANITVVVTAKVLVSLDQMFN